MNSVPTFTFHVEAALSGVRIDSFLVKHLRNYNSWRIQRIVRAGGVTINHVLAAPTDRVFTGQHIGIRLLEPPDKVLEPYPLDLTVLHEDPWLMIINKPAGLVVHPVGEIQTVTLANGIQHLLDQRTIARSILRPGLVHRLDRQTSGAIVVAITHNAHSALSAAFETNRVSKTYLALVEGDVRADTGMLDWPIGRARTGRHVLMSCRADAIDPRPARTRYRVLSRFADYTLVAAKPQTGRNHQIRVHFAQLGHPLVGDEFYERHGRFRPFHSESDPEADRDIETGLPIRRHALHATRLEFSHPVTHLWTTCTAPLPEDLRTTLQALSFDETLLGEYNAVELGSPGMSTFPVPHC